MKRLISAVAAASMLALLAPAASAMSINDPDADAVEFGDIGGKGVDTPFDAIAAKFKEKKKKFVFSLDMQDPVGLEQFCPPGGCEDPQDVGYVDFDFYLLKGDQIAKPYYFLVRNEGGSLGAGLFSAFGSQGGFVAGLKATLDETSTLIKVTVPRKYLHKGYKKGKSMAWFARAAWWFDQSSEVCTYSPKEDQGGACIDWVPNQEDVVEKLKK